MTYFHTDDTGRRRQALGRLVRPLGGSLLLGLLRLVAMSISVAAFIACSSPETFRGTELKARAPATSFTLTNQFSRSVSLDDYRGKVVLLTFLYTSCPDICPLTTSNIREAHELLGSDAKELAMVAVSVDPERDTVEDALDFSQHWQMADRWDFLTGRRAELERIWRAYYIDPSVDGGSDSHETPTATAQGSRTDGVGTLPQNILAQPPLSDVLTSDVSDSPDSLGPSERDDSSESSSKEPALSKARGEPSPRAQRRIAEPSKEPALSPSKGYLVSHSSPVYLVDRAGLMRVVHTLPFDPNALAHDIRLLID